MTAKRDQALDSLEDRLTSLEKVILDTPDSAVLEDPELSAAESSVRRVLAQCLASQQSFFVEKPGAGGGTKSASILRKSNTTEHASRLALVRRLLHGQSRFPKGLIAVFGGKREMNSDEAKKIIDDFVRLNLR